MGKIPFIKNHILNCKKKQLVFTFITQKNGVFKRECPDPFILNYNSTRRD